MFPPSRTITHAGASPPASPGCSPIHRRWNNFGAPLYNIMLYREPLRKNTGWWINCLIAGGYMLAPTCASEHPLHQRRLPCADIRSARTDAHNHPFETQRPSLFGEHRAGSIKPGGAAEWPSQLAQGDTAILHCHRLSLLRKLHTNLDVIAVTFC